MTLIDRSFLWIRRAAFCYRFALFTRILLAAAFLPTGIVKLLGERFTLIGPEVPIGAFFEALYQTGLYWRFIGLSQVIAAILLLIPPLAHLGAILFVPIIANIFVVTVSLQFGATSIVTGLMFLAVTYLCVWDYHRFRSMFTTAPLAGSVPVPRLDRWEAAGFVVFAVALISFFGVTRSLVHAHFGMICVLAGTGAGFFTLGRFLWLWWSQRLEPVAA